MRPALLSASLAAAIAFAALPAQASSHREAPFITEMPKVDNTDFYLFNSYEAGRTGFVTLIANYQPLQDPLGVLADDLAGYPNGRRPGDDAVDISLRVAMGALIEDETVAPAGDLPFTDQARNNTSRVDESFPYLRTPIPGSPQEAGMP